VRVAHAAQLRPALEQALGSSAPVLVEIEIA